MLFDPRRGVLASLFVVGAGVAWLLAIQFESDALFTRLGYAMHAATLLSIFALLAGLAVAGLFLRFHHVRAELLAGRRVVARWRVDAATFASFAPRARASDRRDKRQALAAVGIFVIIIFGAFAVFDRDAAPAMSGFAAAILALIAAAYWLGQRTMARHLHYRGGETIVGERGLMFNGVLHVWSAPLSWLTGAQVSRDGRLLEVDYAFLSRLGAQGVSVAVPVPGDARAEAAAAAERLRALA